MGISRYAIRYACQGQCEYGSCSKTNVFYMEYFRSSDTASIYHKHHLENPESELRKIFSGDDTDFEKLRQLLDMKDTSLDISQEELTQLEKERWT